MVHLKEIIYFLICVSLDSYSFAFCGPEEIPKSRENNALVTNMFSSPLTVRGIEHIVIPEDSLVESESFANSHIKKMTIRVNKGEHITRYAFKCANIYSTIWDTSAEIPNYAFGDCHMRKFEFSANSKSTAIGNDAFSMCEDLHEIILPDSIRQIGNNAFCASGLEKFTATPKLNFLGAKAFKDCANLAEVDLSPAKSLSFIGREIFANTNIRSLYVPGKIQLLSDIAGGCSNLDTIYVGKDIKEVESLDLAVGHPTVYFIMGKDTVVHDVSGANTIAVPVGCTGNVRDHNAEKKATIIEY